MKPSKFVVATPHSLTPSAAATCSRRAVFRPHALAAAMALVAVTQAATASCLILRQPGNFLLTETFPGDINSCDGLGSPVGTFYALGVIESQIFGFGRFVVSQPTTTTLGRGSFNNFAVLEFVGFEVELGDAAFVSNFRNHGTWQLADGYSTSVLNAGSGFDNSGLFIKPGTGTATMESNFTNTGTVRVDGGRLNFNRSFSGDGGALNLLNGATVAFAAGGQALALGNLTGGTFAAGVAGTGLSSGSLNSLGITGALSVNNGSVVSMSGTLTNSGSLTMAGSNATTRVVLTADTTLAGSGQTVISNSPNNHISGNHTLTITSGHTLRGGGQVGSTTYGPLTGIVNQGTLLADAAGGMSIYAGSLNNTNGIVKVADASFITLQGGDLYGGTVNGTGSAYLTGSGVYRDTTLAGVLKVNNGDSLNVAGTLTNNGSFTLAGSNAATRLVLTADTTLAGSGQTVISNSPNNHVSGNHTLTISNGHTLRGGGQVGSTTYGPLTGIVNNGTLLADAAGGMSLYAGSVDNTQGVVRVATTLTLVSGTLAGGGIVSTGSGVLNGGGTYSQTSLSGGFTLGGGSFADATFTDGSTITNGSTVGLSGTLTNSGSLTMAASTAATRLVLAADTTLAGSGQTVIGDSPNNHLSGNHTLTISSGHTLRGGGQVGSTTYGPLTGVVNNGTLLADAVGGMSIYAGSLNNTNGIVKVADASFITLQGGDLYGGTVNGAGSAAISGSGVYRDTTLTGILKVNNGGSLNVAGTLTNSGSFTLAGGNAATRLVLAADTTLAGSGQTVISNSPNNHVSGNHTLTISSGHTLRGGGQVGSTTYGPLAGIVNNGTLLADAVGGMSIYAGSLNNTNGIVKVADASFITLQGGDLYGGTVNGAGSAAISGSGVYRDTTLTGILKVNNGDSVNVSGTLTNSGSLTMAGSNSATRLLLAADTTLAGSGQTFISNSPNNHIYGNHTLTIASGHTLRGGGQVGSTTYGPLTGIVNKGTLLAEAAGGMSLYAGGRITNQSFISIASGSSLDVSHNHIEQTTANAAIQVDGTLRVQQLDLARGTLTGDGTVIGNVNNTAGTIAAGHSPGKLSIIGNLILGDGALIVVDAAGGNQGVSYDWLALTGNAALDGDVRFDFGYSAAVGDSFSFLSTSTGAVSGTFDAVYASGYTLDVSYGVQNVTVTVASITAVPEPQTWALWLAGLGLVGWMSSQRLAARA